MRILVLTTTARITPEWVADLLESLPLAESPELAVVAVTAPKVRLPVERCLVVGPFLRPGRQVRDVAVLGGSRRPTAGRRVRWARRLDRALTRAVPSRWSKDRMLMLSTGAVRSRAVREEFARADLVIAHDFNTTWAAWKLARRIPGPHVVFQVEGASLWLAERGSPAH
jgi:hypothetical protein